MVGLGWAAGRNLRLHCWFASTRSCFKWLSPQGKSFKWMQIVLASHSGMLKLSYTALGFYIKANVNVIYGLAQSCKAAQLYRGFRTLKYLDLSFINRYFVIGFSKCFSAGVQEGNCYCCLHDTHVQEVSRTWQVPFKARWPKKCVGQTNIDWLISWMSHIHPYHG